MKFIAIVGTNATKSYNRKLLQFMSNYFAKEAEIEIAEIKDIPLFCEDYETTPQSVLKLAEKIEAADGVIFGTPEYDHDIPAALKSVIEWLSWKVHPLTKKPVMIVGASLGNLGTVQAQESLRRILDSPGLGSFVLPGFQFLLGRAESAFDPKGALIDQGTIGWLAQCFEAFVNYTTALEQLKETAQLKKPASDQIERKALQKQEAKSALKALDELDTTTGASEKEESFDDANGITFVLDDNDEFELPDQNTSASKKPENDENNNENTDEKPALIYTDDALTGASEKVSTTPTKSVDNTTGASEK